MSVIATALKHLIAAGVSGDDLVRAVEEMETEAANTPTPKDLAAERRREWDRNRKRAEREAEIAYLSGGIPPDPVESGGNCADEAPSLDKSPQTPKINPNPPVGVGSAPARKGSAFPVPEGCDPGDWRDLLANRKSKRLPMTTAAYRKILRDLAEHSDDEWPPGRVLRHAAEKGWAAIFDPRERPGYRNGQRPSNDRTEGPINPMVAAGVRIEARIADRGAASF